MPRNSFYYLVENNPEAINNIQNIIDANNFEYNLYAIQVEFMENIDIVDKIIIIYGVSGDRIPLYVRSGHYGQ